MTVTDPIAVEYEVREAADGGLRAVIKRVTGGLVLAGEDEHVHAWRVRVGDQSGREVHGYDPRGGPMTERVELDAYIRFDSASTTETERTLRLATSYAHDAIAALRDHSATVNDAHEQLAQQINAAESHHGVTRLGG